MNRLIDRTAIGAFALFLVVAVASVSTARAQQAGPPGPTIVPTACGAGVLDECATQTMFKCEWHISINFLTVPYGGGFSFYEVCIPAGTRPIYKDRLGVAGGGTCSVSRPNPLGDDDGTQQPFEGDGTCDG